MTFHAETDLVKMKMAGNRTRKEQEKEISEMENMGLQSAERTSTPNNAEKVEPPHCPAELVKALRMRGLRVNIAGPLGERINNDLMMEGWQGRRPKDEK
jgi:hypothetical protein